MNCALIIGVVTVVINIFAFLKNYTGTYLWAYDITYVAGIQSYVKFKTINQRKIVLTMNGTLQNSSNLNLPADRIINLIIIDFDNGPF